MWTDWKVDSTRFLDGLEVGCEIRDKDDFGGIGL